jgi:hypothetical protein
MGRCIGCNLSNTPDALATSDYFELWERCSIDGRSLGSKRTSFTQALRANVWCAVRRKWILPSCRWRSCTNVSGLWLEHCAPGHHGYQRACDLISGQASTGPFGSPVFARAGKTEPPSRLILSQTSAGKLAMTLANDYAA